MWILVTDGDELLGMAAIGEDHKGLFVYNVAVDHLHRRRHVGSQMMEVLCKTCPGKACRGRVSKDNEAAIHFYEIRIRDPSDFMKRWGRCEIAKMKGSFTIDLCCLIDFYWGNMQKTHLGMFSNMRIACCSALFWSMYFIKWQ